jgi:hypothetical protein
MNTPRFARDCGTGCCTFVGRTLRSDVYVTRSGGMIMRDGNDGPDYCSYLTMAIAHMVAARCPEGFHAVELVERHLSS